MKKLLFVALCILLFISLIGCSSSQNEISAGVVSENVLDVENFKCVCSIDQQAEFVIEGKDSKDLYNYILEQWKLSDKAESQNSQSKDIYMSFQDGEPLEFSNQNSINSDIIAESESNFYGVFWVSENDYLTYTSSPMTSYQETYKLPEGTYTQIIEMIAQTENTDFNTQ